ncbi:sensor histidine kinase [Candidatus Frankia nodulisporulans]|uniref:sensor histidine kinase n=1 Tax=Candidatus Frankia nodulisporulans TaxID=2060052 RepID=UPI0013D52391|nr:ATP-binding protein [Candidatus Frankia nodulisporulans]
MPLRVRLTALFVLGTALALFLAGILFYLLLRANLRDAVDSDLRTRVDVLAARTTDRYPAVTAATTPGSTTPGSTTPGSTALLAGAGPIAQILGPDGLVLAATADAGQTPLLDARTLATARTRALLTTVRSRPGMEPDGRLRLATEPVTVPGTGSAATTGSAAGGPLVAVVGTSTLYSDRAEDRVRNVMVVATAPLVALSGLAAWLLSGAALRPVERMRRDAAALAAAEDHARTPGPPAPPGPPVPSGPSGALALAVPATRDEIAALARTMNDLLARLHAARTRDRAFIADAGHELRTPLTVLRAELELAARPGRSVTQLRAAISGAAEETERLIRLAESLLTLARMDGGHLRRAPVALDEIVLRATQAAAGLATSRDVHLTIIREPPVQVSSGPLVEGDPDLLRQCVDNLLTNALRHAPAASTVDLTIGPTTRSGQAGVRLTVRDWGPGFPGTFLPHAFERFRRADAARGRNDGGTGLGLAIVAAIIAAHGGSVTAANHPDGGAVLTIWLPREGTRVAAAGAGGRAGGTARPVRGVDRDAGDDHRESPR